MQEMIVLGQIPGTNIYVDFGTWMFISISMLLLLVTLLYQKQLLRYWDAYLASLRARKVLHLLTQYHLL